MTVTSYPVNAGRIEVKSKAGVWQEGRKQTLVVEPFSVGNQSRYVHLRISQRCLCKNENACSTLCKLNRESWLKATAVCLVINLRGKLFLV